MRSGRLVLVAVAGLVVAVAGTVLAVAVNAATGGTVPWFPAVEHDSLWWTAGATVGVAAAGLLVWWGQRWYDAGLRELVPAVQRPESWVVDRPAEVGRIVAAVRAGGQVRVTTAIHGAGGSGKTTIAKMVRADPRVLRRFGGRVYWVTVGRDAGRQSLAGLVNDLITRLAPDRPVTFTDAREAAEYLAAILAGGPRRLLVLDDVWSQAQLDVFPVAGRCARLVTTRNASLVGGAGVPILVDRMTQRQANAVLSAGLPGLPPAVSAQLVAETACWPLLVRLVNKILIDRARLQPDVMAAAGDLLALLRQGRVLTLDGLSGAAVGLADVGDPDQRARSVRATIEASTGLLDPAQRARLAELAVFAEDETIPVTLTAALWQASAGLGQDAALALLARLDDLALLTLTPSPEGGTIELHDVIRDFLREELGESRQRQLHRALVGCAAAGLPAAPAGNDEDTVSAWWEIPERSRYLRDHLIEHLIGAQDPRAAELAATDLRWAAARLKQSGPTAPYGDLSLIGTPRARRLQRLLGQSAHLLAATEPPYSQIDILCSRVSHDPDWGPQARALQAASTYPGLVSEFPLADLPDPTLRRTLTAHNGGVSGVAIAPDGKWLATAGEDGTVRIWDVATGEQRVALAGHRGGVSEVAIAPDGTWLATAGYDGRIRIWDVATGQQRGALAGHERGVSGVAIAPDGTWLATVGYDSTVRIWDVATGEQRVALAGHHGWVSEVAIAPDGTWLTSAGEDGTVRIWDVATGEQRAALAGHERGVNGVAIAPDGTWLATTGYDRPVRIWDAATGQQRAPLTGYSSGLIWVTGVAIAPDGTWLATAGDQGVRIWDAATGQQRAALAGHDGRVHAVAIAPDGTWLAAVGGDGTVRIWDAATMQQQAPMTGYGRRVRGVRGVAIAPDGTWLATAGDQGVRIWDAATGQQRAALAGHDGRVHAVAIAPDGTWLATVGGDGTVRIWDAATGEERAARAGHLSAVSGVAIAPDGTWLATVGHDGTVRIWDAATGQQRAAPAGHERGVNGVAIAPDGTWLATVGHDGTVRIWDAATGQQRAALAGHLGGVSGVAIAPDGTWLATVGGDGAVRIWDAATGEQRAALAGHDGTVGGVAIAPDGTWLATVGDDRTLRVWDRATGRASAVMRVDGTLTNCEWSPSGQSIAAVGALGWYYFTFRP